MVIVKYLVRRARVNEVRKDFCVMSTWYDVLKFVAGSINGIFQVFPSLVNPRLDVFPGTFTGIA
jgi:hypothetical protein